MLLYVAGRMVSRELLLHLGPLMLPHNEPMLHGMIMTTTAIYMCLMAVPFMPAAEIGLSMLVVFGGKIAFLVYISTVGALTVSFVVGRLVPAAATAKLLGTLGLSKAQHYVNRLAPLSKEQRVSLMQSHAPSGPLRAVLRFRLLTLAVLLNLPGNVVLGGGGGIAMLAGMSRLYPFPVYFLVMALAVAPVPLVVFLTD